LLLYQETSLMAERQLNELQQRIAELEAQLTEQQPVLDALRAAQHDGVLRSLAAYAHARHRRALKKVRRYQEAQVEPQVIQIYERRASSWEQRVRALDLLAALELPGE
jgi:hypothetical protein